MMQSRPLIFVVISILVVVLIYSSVSASGIYAVPPDPNRVTGGTCGAPTTNPETGETKQTCCWKQRGPYPKIGETMYCQTCYTYTTEDQLVFDCDEKQEQEARPPSAGVSPEDKVLEQPPTPPVSRLPSGDLGNLPTLEQVPPTCPALEELDEETNQCVPIESPVAEQPQEATEEPEQQQEEQEEQSEPEPSDESDQEGNSDNNN